MHALSGLPGMGVRPTPEEIGTAGAVEVGGDPALAAAPALVQNYMSQLAIRLVQGIAALDYATQERISASARVLTVVQFACRVFELFLRIHPYANGNDHVARFVVWGVLGRY